MPLKKALSRGLIQIPHFLNPHLTKSTPRASLPFPKGKPSRKRKVCVSLPKWQMKESLQKEKGKPESTTPPEELKRKREVFAHTINLAITDSLVSWSFPPPSVRSWRQTEKKRSKTKKKKKKEKERNGKKKRKTGAAKEQKNRV